MCYQLEQVARYFANPAQNVKEFCIKENLTVGYFYYCRKKHQQLELQLHTQISPCVFLPLEITAPPQKVSPTGGMNQTFPNGVVLCMDLLPEASVLSELINTYR